MAACLSLLSHRGFPNPSKIVWHYLEYQTIKGKPFWANWMATDVSKLDHKTADHIVATRESVVTQNEGINSQVVCL